MRPLIWSNVVWFHARNPASTSTSGKESFHETALQATLGGRGRAMVSPVCRVRAKPVGFGHLSDYPTLFAALAFGRIRKREMQSMSTSTHSPATEHQK